MKISHNKALHWTVIPLRSIASGELGRWEIKNMKLIQFVLCLLLLSNTGCLAQSPERISVTNSSDRIEIFGVSMLPPQESGWQYEKLSPAKIEFAKGHNKEASFIVYISLSKLPSFESKEEFMTYLSEQRQRNTGNPRFENILNTEEFSEEKETPSMRFHTKYKDKDSPHLPKGEPYYITDEYGIFCRHPKAWGVSVNIVCSQRTIPNRERLDWKSLADEFIKNVEFIDFPTE